MRSTLQPLRHMAFAALMLAVLVAGRGDAAPSEPPSDRASWWLQAAGFSLVGASTRGWTFVRENSVWTIDDAFTGRRRAKVMVAC